MEGGRFSNARMARRLDSERKERSPHPRTPADAEYEAMLRDLGKRLKKLEQVEKSDTDPAVVGEALDYFSQRKVRYGFSNGIREARKQYVAAVKGFGLANKLKNPKDRNKHKSRTMTVMNMLDAHLSQLEKQWGI